MDFWKINIAFLQKLVPSHYAKKYPSACYFNWILKDGFGNFFIFLENDSAISKTPYPRVIFERNESYFQKAASNSKHFDKSWKQIVKIQTNILFSPKTTF